VVLRVERALHLHERNLQQQANSPAGQLRTHTNCAHLCVQHI
jgi:hypothetical protein